MVSALIATLEVALETAKPSRRKSAIIALTVRNPKTIAAFLEVASKFSALCGEAVKVLRFAVGNSLVVTEIATDSNHSSFCGLSGKGVPPNNEVIKIYELTYPDKQEQDT